MSLIFLSRLDAVYLNTIKHDTMRLASLADGYYVDLIPACGKGLRVTHHSVIAFIEGVRYHANMHRLIPWKAAQRPDNNGSSTFISGSCKPGRPSQRARTASLIRGIRSPRRDKISKRSSYAASMT